MATECDTDSVLTMETDLTNDTMVTTANGKLTDNSASETSVDDVEPLLVSHDPVIKTNWKNKFWELFYDRIYCCHGCNLRNISCKPSRKHLISARAKLVEMGKLLMDRRVIVSVSLYGLLGFVTIISNEVIILFIMY